MVRHFGAGPTNVDKMRSLVVVVLVFAFLLLLLGGVWMILRNPVISEPQLSLVVENEVDPEPAMKMVPVLIPKQEIQAGTLLRKEMFDEQQKKQYLIEDETKLVTQRSDVVNYYAKTTLLQGQVLLWDYLTESAPTSDISAKIPPGYRAVTIEVNVTSSVEGWVRPGSRVDVIWASSIRGKPGVTTIVQNAKILSAERSVSGAPAEAGAPVPSTVTLLVTADDSKKIQLASTTGKLSLSLRGDRDAGKVDEAGSITINDLIEGASNRTQKRNHQGMVVIGGKRWIIQDGEMVPMRQEHQ